ncbi:hypothetical protein CHELA20_53564 [Hyphomicrobiales bacterium]|nr:hypothetical protein CHELA41_21363 [Hyphomicrobiales bacterium]CAH1684502.1 hypothetical protein CHELA20_53564 [Hyphomicrobiales bacterium]
MRHDQDITEQDGGVEAEPTDGLKSDLGGEAGGVAEVEKRSGFRAQSAIFREITPGLAHHPERRRGHRFPGERPEDRGVLALGGLQDAGHTISLFKSNLILESRFCCFYWSGHDTCAKAVHKPSPDCSPGWGMDERAEEPPHILTNR